VTTCSSGIAWQLSEIDGYYSGQSAGKGEGNGEGNQDYIEELSNNNAEQEEGHGANSAEEEE